MGKRRSFRNGCFNRAWSLRPHFVRKNFAVFLFLLGLFLILSGQSSKEQVSSSASALVTRVIDGDSFYVEINGKTEQVRALGIDAPEYNECFGTEAKKEASKLLSSKSIILENDPTQSDRDIYNRLLRYMFINNLNFDEEMIRQGFAKEYTFKGISYKYQKEFKKVQNQAREAGKGLWSACE